MNCLRHPDGTPKSQGNAFTGVFPHRPTPFDPRCNNMKPGVQRKPSLPIPPQSDTLKRRTWAKRPI